MIGYYFVKSIEILFSKFKTIIFRLYLKFKYSNRVKIGKNFKFRRGLVINVSKTGILYIGDNCFFNNYCSINVHKKIVIGNDNIFGENVKIYDHDHVFNEKEYKTYKENEVNIGNKNWIASNVTILRKGSIGNGNVIGAGIVLNFKVDNDCLIKIPNTCQCEKILRKN